MIEFTHKNIAYRITRGVGTNQWLLLGELPGQSGSWRLIDNIPASVYDVDVKDYAINLLKMRTEPWWHLEK